MKLVDFSIAKDCIELERDSHYFDLHNSFDFIGLAYSSAQRTLELRWIRGAGEWVRPNTELRLEFVGVYLFKARERDREMPFTEDDCLASVGFIWDDMLAEMTATLPTNKRMAAPTLSPCSRAALASRSTLSQ